MAGKTGVFRNVNILHELNAATGTSTIDLYQPGWLNPFDVNNGLKYSGFITSLRLTIDLPSIPELRVIDSDLLDSQTVIDSNTQETFNHNSKKCLSFYMKTAVTPPIKVVDVYLFNQRPFYYLDLLPYFTAAGTFDLAPDAMISCQIRDVGNGLLNDDDRLLILGTVVEESSDVISPLAESLLEIE
ncbi:hypothetical protein H6G04_22275 [Calothrix membranacea FACHB-236]|nr:hypothetical protein [Calothrix membranacea FACHB-236]